MRVREAVEADAGRIAAIADVPADVMRNLVHDRTVRVAEAQSDDAGSATEREVDDDSHRDAGLHERVPGASTPEESDIMGFVSFDARDDVVHVTQIQGSEEVCERLLDEPVGFARREGMTVEMIVPDTDEETRAAAESSGFEERGPGPRFEGQETVRYRLDSG